MTADLARARTYGAPASVLRSLERWAGAGHNLLYRVTGESIVSVRRWMTSGFPKAVRTYQRPILLAVLLLFGPMGISYGLVRSNPVLARYMTSSAMLERAESTRGETSTPNTSTSRERSCRWPPRASSPTTFRLPCWPSRAGCWRDR